MFRQIMGGAGFVGGQEKEWMVCFLVDLRAFGINGDDWTTAAYQDEGEWRLTSEEGDECFKAKWIVAKKTKSGLQHVVVCPNVTRRTRLRIAQSEQARAGSLVLVESPQIVTNLYPPGVSFADAFAFSCVASFFDSGFVEASSLRYAGVPIPTFDDLFYFYYTLIILFILRGSFSEFFVYHFRSLTYLYGEYVVRSFLPDEVFACGHGLDLGHQPT